MPFGYLLKRFRVEKGLSQRELAEAAGIDHGYIARLETREKERPTEQMVEKLVCGLSLADREAWLLGFVGEFGKYLDKGMIEYAVEHPAITREELSWAMAVKYRCPELDYPTLFTCARRVGGLVEWFVQNQKKLAKLNA